MARTTPHPVGTDAAGAAAQQGDVSEGTRSNGNRRAQRLEPVEVTQVTAFQLMIKPCGPSCNLRCTYCYYLPKGRMFGEGDRRMSLETLEELTRQYIRSQGGVVTFAWQGGEPTLAGLEFFQEAVRLQEKYRRHGTVIENTLQTNGTLLDDEWCRFLHDSRFLVGLSVDGPSSLHDIYRRDKSGNPTSGRVVRASRLLRKHRVEFNTLTVVNRGNARHPLQVYRFLRNVIGARYMQFIPCVEPEGFEGHPPRNESHTVTDWSVDPGDYGSFLIAVFDEWAQRDVGRVFVINFEVALASWLGLPPTACTYAKSCGNALAVEHDGSVFSCDHFVYPEYRLGNVRGDDLVAMVSSERQVRFGEEKMSGLPGICRDCEVLFACRGECPKNRLVRSPSGENGLNYLCPGLRRFFAHIGPWMTAMAGEVRAGRRAENVVGTRAERGRQGRRA